MIKINLVPPELQGKKVKKIKAAGAAPGAGGASSVALGFGVGIVVIVLAAVLAWLSYSEWNKQAESNKKLADAKSNLVDLTTEYNRKLPIYQEKLEKMTRMKNQQEILRVLMPKNRLLWAEKIHMLAALRPIDVYITSLKLTEKVKMVETSQSAEDRRKWAKKKTELEGEPNAVLPPEPVVVKKPIITQSLAIRAISPLGEESDRINKLTEFVENMASYRAKRGEDIHLFSEGFQLVGEESDELEIAYGSQQEKVFDGVPVWEFELTIKTRPFGFDPTK